MSPWTTFIILVGLAGSLLTIYEFIKARTNKTPGSRQLAVVFGTVTLAIVLVSVIFANILSPLFDKGPGIAPTQSVNTPQSGTGTITTQGQSTTLSTPTPTLTPTQVAVSPGTVICDTANSGQGWNNWNLVTGWKVLNGELLYDGTGNGEKLVAPDFCQPTTPNYAVDVRMRIVAACCHFGIMVRSGASTTGETGYELSIYTTTFQNVFIVSHGGQGGATGSHSFDNNFHVYRAEVKDNIINFVIDRAKVLSATDNTFLSPGEVSICCTDTMELEITSFKITAL